MWGMEASAFHGALNGLLPEFDYRSWTRFANLVLSFSNYLLSSYSVPEII